MLNHEECLPSFKSTRFRFSISTRPSIGARKLIEVIGAGQLPRFTTSSRCQFAIDGNVFPLVKYLGGELRPEQTFT